MIKLISKEETSKMICRLLSDLSCKFSYSELSIMLDVNEKTIYKWRLGNIPKADNFINLQVLHSKLFNQRKRIDIDCM